MKAERLTITPLDINREGMDLIGRKKSRPEGSALPAGKGFIRESFMKRDRSPWLWEWMAFFYERFFSKFPAYQKLLKDIIESLPPADPASNDIILDAGCGVGLLSFELARRGHVVAGIDRSPQMIDRAKKKKEKERLDNLTFWEKDLNEEWDLPGFSCQTILLIHSLYLLKDPFRTVKRLASFLVKGGQIITCNPSRKLRFVEIWKGGYSFLAAAMRERGALSVFPLLTVALVMGALNFMIQRKKNRIFHCWDEKELIELMKKCDLRVKRTQRSCLAGSHFLVWAVKES